MSTCTAITRVRARASASPSEKITVYWNAGEASQVAKGFWPEEGNFHRIFDYDVLKLAGGCFALFPLKDGIRDNNHAMPTSIFALDFDDPNCPSLSSVMSYFEGCEYALYTTKSHQRDKHGITCDRYRIVLPLDRPIAPDQMPDIVDYFADVWHSDSSTKDGGRFFFCGTATSEVHYGFGHPVSSDWLLRLAPQETHQNGPVERYKESKVKTRQTRENLVIEEGKAHSKHVAFLRERWATVQGKNENTYEAVFALMLLWIQEFGFSLGHLKAALPKVDDIADFYARHPQQWHGIDSTLQKALGYVVNNSRNTLQHRNPVAEIDLSALPFTPELMDICLKAGDMTGHSEVSFSDAAQLIGHVFGNYRKGIIDIQCGQGKSVVASAIIARSKDRWLIVRDTNEQCRKQRDMLIGYGVPTGDISVLSGWSADSCQTALDAWEKVRWSAAKRKMLKPAIDKARGSIKDGFTPFYSKASSPCIDCRARCDFRGSRTHRKVAGALRYKRVVIMTHSRFLEVVHFAELRDRRVLIDEEPAVYEGVSFSANEIELLLHTFNGCLAGKVDRHLKGLVNSQKTGTIEDHCAYDHKELKTLQGRASGLDQDAKEVCYRYLRFFGYEADRYAFVEGDRYGKKVSFARNRLNFDIPNDVYVLTASARFSLCVWDGFTVVRCADQMTAEGVTVYAYEANSTKHRMDKEAARFMEYALERVRANGRKKVLLATNKEESKSAEVKQAVELFKRECEKMGVEVEEAERGSIIGRNDWNTCDCVVMAYGVFTSVSNIALKQSLVEGSEIEGCRIWDVKEIEGVEIRQPRIRKGIVDSGMRETDRRLYADEIYQVGLRGRARNWKEETMDIITVAPSIDYVVPLQQVLPHARIVFDELDLSGIKTEELLKNDSELAKTFGMTDNAASREAARGMANDLLNERLGEADYK